MKKKFRKPLSVLTSVSMALSLMSSLPAGVNAVDGVSFLGRQWNAGTKTVNSFTSLCWNYTVVDSGTRTLSGWCVVKDNVNISKRLEVKGTANLILCDGAGCTARTVSA